MAAPAENDDEIKSIAGNNVAARKS